MLKCVELVGIYGFAIFFAVAMEKIIFRSEESDVAVIAMSRLDLDFEIMLTRIEVDSLS